MNAVQSNPGSLIWTLPPTDYRPVLFVYLRWYNILELVCACYSDNYITISVVRECSRPRLIFMLMNVTLQSFTFVLQSWKLIINHLYFSPFLFTPISRPGPRLRFMFRCLRFLHFHAPTPALIALQTSLKRINFLISGSSRGIISRVRIVCDYCSVTPDADPGLCAALYVWEECRRVSSLQIPLFYFIFLTNLNHI